MEPINYETYLDCSNRNLSTLPEMPLLERLYCK